MSKKVTIILVIAVAAVLLFTACERSAKQPQLATPTVGTTGAEATPTSMSLVQAWGTSTAIYVQTAVALGTYTAVPDASGTGATATSVVPATGEATATPVPVTNPVVVVPTATPGRPATYTLQSGEFPYCIARRFNTDPDDLLSANGIKSGEILQPGLVLNIPATGSFPGARALRSHPATYTVAVDDTIYKIACYYGDVDPSAIAAANNLALTSPLTTGQILNIP
jgi:LysM repeat protein